MLTFVKIFVRLYFKPWQTRAFKVNPLLLVNCVCGFHFNSGYRFTIAIEDNIRLSGLNETLDFHAIPIG